MVFFTTTSPKPLILAGLFLAALAAWGAPGPVLNVGFNGNPDTLDPQKTSGTITFQIDRSIYDTLVEPDAQGKLSPALAEKWTISSDFKTWTFTLRKGVVFHNGSPFTSADVKATLTRLTDKATASPSAAEYSGIQDIQTPDASTVILVLSKPNAPLLSTLASGWSAILPKALIDSGWDFANKPVGTGPFVFKQWVRDGQIVLEKNDRYWQKGLPKLAGVTFQIIPESAVSTQALQTGAIDYVDGVSDADLAVLAPNKALRVVPLVTSIVNVISINTRRPALKDVRVRQALSWAIDRRAVLDAAYGKGPVTGTFDEPSDPYYKDFTGLYGYDPAKAKALLTQAGYDFSQTLDLVVSSLFDAHVKATQIYQQQLEAVGVHTKIRVVEWSKWISDVYFGAHDFDLTVIGHTGKLDPSGRLASPLYGTEATYVGWVNPAVADQITKASEVVKFEDRKKLYDQVFEALAKEAPFVYVGAPVSNAVVRTSVTGIIKTPKLDTYDFRQAEKK
jgi:peptide/nickel transport system substrate-binding protein